MYFAIMPTTSIEWHSIEQGQAAAIPITSTHTHTQNSLFLSFFSVCFVGAFLSARDENTQCWRRQHNSIHANAQLSIGRSGGGLARRIATNALLPLLSCSYSFHFVLRFLVSIFPSKLYNVQFIVNSKQMSYVLNAFVQ